MSSLDRRPTPGRGWQRRTLPQKMLRDPVLVGYAWWRAGVLVVSTLDYAEMPDGDGLGLQWHVSVSGSTDAGRPRRPRDGQLARAVRDFRIEGWEEDNHHPGAARHFWRPLDPDRRVECECKEDELVVVETDGYRWTTPLSGPCRGCEMAATMPDRVCPLHAG